MRFQAWNPGRVIFDAKTSEKHKNTTLCGIKHISASKLSHKVMSQETMDIKYSQFQIVSSAPTTSKKKFHAENIS